MQLKAEQVASISAVKCKGKGIFIWLLTKFGKSVCYETISFVMDCKLGRLDSESGKYSSSRSLVLVHHIIKHVDREHHMLLPICLGIEYQALLFWVGWAWERG